MRFSRIEVENWGPYRGSHQIDISATPSAPLVLIFGENGRGKTSLAKAIKWCLYESQSEIDALSMANRQMASLEDEFQVGVKVVFEYERVTSSNTPYLHKPSNCREHSKSNPMRESNMEFVLRVQRKRVLLSMVNPRFHQK